MAGKRCVLITGCSGGGKSTLLAELKGRGHAVIEEPGRRIIAEERASTGNALPWRDPTAFAQRAVALSRADLATGCPMSGLIFFDRGLIDAAIALHHAAGVAYRGTLGSSRHYSDPVFLAPPWPEIYATDTDRRHDLATAILEFERLRVALDHLGYAVCLLPKTAVEDRADFVLSTIAQKLRSGVHVT